MSMAAEYSPTASAKRPSPNSAFPLALCCSALFNFNSAVLSMLSDARSPSESTVTAAAAHLRTATRMGGDKAPF